jgi:UPF0271 protein
MDKIILDTAGFLAGIENAFPRVYTTAEVISEVKDSSSLMNLNMAISSGKVIVFKPKESSVKEALSYASKVKDYSLSKTDISILALALELKPCVVFTDDFSLQNVLKIAEIDYRSVKVNRKINEIREFYYKCESCGKTYTKYIEKCNICGSRVIKTRRNNH